MRGTCLHSQTPDFSMYILGFDICFCSCCILYTSSPPSLFLHFIVSLLLRSLSFNIYLCFVPHVPSPFSFSIPSFSVWLFPGTFSLSVGFFCYMHHCATAKQYYCHLATTTNRICDILKSFALFMCTS